MRELVSDIRDLMCDRSVKNNYLVRIIILTILSWTSLGVLLALNPHPIIEMVIACGLLTLSATGIAIGKLCSKSLSIALIASIVLNLITTLIH